MPTLLHLAASPRGERSHSRRAAAALATRWRTRGAGFHVIERDLAIDPPAHLDAAFVEASLTHAHAREARHHAALARSEALIRELDDAAAVLISSPIHNFALPSTLKAWIDHVVRPGRTFELTAQGKRGLLRDRPVRIVLACGGALGDTAGGQPDWATPYLRHVLGTIGLHDVQVHVIEQTRRGPVHDHVPSQWLGGAPFA
ncbi:MAG: FMN-dependent NADH-azoreductase [Gammaproteobacteria bacterium]